MYKVLIIIFFIGFISCDNEEQYSKYTELEGQATFVGNNTCLECHEAEYNDWMNSDHERAMDTVSVKSVTGNFNNTTFTAENGYTSKFYMRDGRYFVFTKGEDGVEKEMEITYVFGIRPLQQYLIETDKGRLQCLPIAWDLQQNDWFSLVDSLYHGQKIESDNWLYWTNNGQNWNGMCAECHTTNYHKGYNMETKEFHTTYSDINVGCETCHGPASIHNKWAAIDEKERPEIENTGFHQKTHGLNSQELINQCGYCHARRTSFGDNDHANDHYMQNWVPQLLHDRYYYTDGQILDEDYVTGSFIQSKMFRHGIKCTDCHDPHTNKTKLKGNQLCHQCHIPNDYEEKHHFHKKTGGIGNPTVNGYYDNEQGDGTQCVDCHMSGANFMGVDFRRDHSFRVPRPDLSIRNGTPNACNQCHKDKSNEWSVETIEKWYGHKLEHENTVMFNAFADARKGDYEIVPILINEVLKQDSINEIYRATAVAYLGRFSTVDAMKAIETSLTNTNPLIRHTAVINYENPDKSAFIKKLSPLLSDSIKAVRIAVLQKISIYPTLKFDPRYDREYQKALDEYRSAMEHTSDFPSSMYNLANLSIKEGDDSTAINMLKESLRIDNMFYPSSVTLSILLSRNGNPAEAKKVLEDAVGKSPDLFEGYYYLGLISAEEKNNKKAVEYLTKALDIQPYNDRVAYNLGLLYQGLKDVENAEKYLLTAVSLNPENDAYMYAVAILYLNSNQGKKAQQTVMIMFEKFPNSQYTVQLQNIFQQKAVR
jgi:tetratricopeptide (TPR) repeat protein